MRRTEGTDPFSSLIPVQQVPREGSTRLMQLTLTAWQSINRGVGVTWKGREGLLDAPTSASIIVVLGFCDIPVGLRTGRPPKVSKCGLNEHFKNVFGKGLLEVQ